MEILILYNKIFDLQKAKSFKNKEKAAVYCLSPLRITPQATAQHGTITNKNPAFPKKCQESQLKNYFLFTGIQIALW
ncbi:MAG: hypothetical protein IJP90_04000 [Treponema sp.]|nr:hypothetical protein [Treponema sp.]